MRRALCVLLLPLLLAACSDEGRFSPERWAQTDPARRSTLTSDLISRRLLVGKSGSEVMSMLGSPRTVSREGATWFVGVDEKQRPMVLQVDFEDGKATQVRIHRE